MEGSFSGGICCLFGTRLFLACQIGWVIGLTAYVFIIVIVVLLVSVILLLSLFYCPGLLHQLFVSAPLFHSESLFFLQNFYNNIEIILFHDFCDGLLKGTHPKCVIALCKNFGICFYFAKNTVRATQQIILYVCHHPSANMDTQQFDC